MYMDGSIPSPLGTGSKYCRFAALWRTPCSVIVRLVEHRLDCFRRMRGERQRENEFATSRSRYTEKGEPCGAKVVAKSPLELPGGQPASEKLFRPRVVIG